MVQQHFSQFDEENPADGSEDSWQEEDEFQDDECDDDEDEDEFDEDEDGSVFDSDDDAFDESAARLRQLIYASVEPDEQEEILNLLVELIMRHGEAIDLLEEHDLLEQLDSTRELLD